MANVDFLQKIAKEKDTSLVSLDDYFKDLHDKYDELACRNCGFKGYKQYNSRSDSRTWVCRNCGHVVDSYMSGTMSLLNDLFRQRNLARIYGRVKPPAGKIRDDNFHVTRIPKVSLGMSEIQKHMDMGLYDTARQMACEIAHEFMGVSIDELYRFWDATILIEGNPHALFNIFFYPVCTSSLVQEDFWMNFPCPECGHVSADCDFYWEEDGDRDSNWIQCGNCGADLTDYDRFYSIARRIL